MEITFDRSEDWIPLTCVKMARSRGRRDDAGIILNQPIYGRDQFDHQREPPKWKTLIILLTIVMLVSFVLFCGSSLNTRLQKYTPFTHTTEVAELTILKTREGQHQLSIVLTLIEPNGFQKSYTLPLLQGDNVILQDEYILVPPLPGFLELHSGYIVISLDVLNKNGTKVYSLQLNEAENDHSIPAQLVSLLVTRKYGNITLMPSRSVYKICITQTGLLKEC